KWGVNKIIFGCCTKVIMSGVNGNVIMSGYGDDNPDDERREAARGYTKSIYEEGRGTASSFNPCPLNPIKIDIRRAYRILSTQTAIGGLAPSFQWLLGFPKLPKPPVARQFICVPYRRVKSNFLSCAREIIRS